MDSTPQNVSSKCKFHFAVFQPDHFPPPSIPLEELFNAYFCYRKNRRRTANGAAFEVNYEENLVGLWRGTQFGINPQESETFYFPGDDLFAPLTRRRGLPIGNLTSQHFANFYLHTLDHFITDRLRLVIHHGRAQPTPSTRPLPFLGDVVTSAVIRVQGKNIRRARRRRPVRLAEVRRGERTPAEYKSSVFGWLGYAALGGLTAAVAEAAGVRRSVR